MALISAQHLSIRFGGPAILTDVTLNIERSERICLVGRNGSGKSTLLKLIAGQLQPDGGELVREQSTRVAFLPQDVPAATSGTVFDIVAQGLGEAGQALVEHHHLTQAASADPAANARLSRLQQTLQQGDGWQLQTAIEQTLNRMGLDEQARFEALSGGLKRRVLLAQALVSQPDVLLLDEPTNHLDIESIDWLEDFLVRFEGAVLFVTHDRNFLQKLATRIVELDRGDLSSWNCTYNLYLERKAAQLEAEQKQWDNFDKKVAQEEIWIRQGISARRTRNMGRVRNLIALREQRRKRRSVDGAATMVLAQAQRSGALVIEAQNLGFGYQNVPLVKDFSTVLSRGDRVGIIGANGSGKTTLLKLLLGQLAPQQGTVRQGTNLEIAYFDQLRASIDPQKTVWENVCPHGDTVIIQGNPRHIVSYLKDFLFSPERINTPAAHLSGGERNRLLLAQTFTRPCNLLVMDEPTNDLDIETLELLEELLGEFSGTLLLVSHDRAFLNNVVTSTIVLEGNGVVREYVGGYDDWVRQRPAPIAAVTEAAKPRPAPKSTPPRRKLSFNEVRELEALPRRIEELELEHEQMVGRLSDPALYQQAGDAVGPLKAQLATVEQQLKQAYARWEELEEVGGEA